MKSAKDMAKEMFISTTNDWKKTQRERDRDAPEENGKLNYTVVMVVSWYPVIKPKQKWNRIKTTVKENKHQSNSEFYFHCTHK